MTSDSSGSMAFTSPFEHHRVSRFQRFEGLALSPSGERSREILESTRPPSGKPSSQR
jgi:hypothetical protein